MTHDPRLDSIARGGIAGFVIGVVFFAFVGAYNWASSTHMVACSDAPGWVQLQPAPEWWKFWKFRHCDTSGIIPMHPYIRRAAPR